MTADLMVVFAFQTLYGYVYHWIGLLITAFMAGLSLGGLLMTRKLNSGARHLQSRKCLVPYEKFTLLKLELAILLYWALLPIALSTLHSRISHPLANRMWLKDREDLRGTVGVLYACDLVGAFLGSIVVSVILIPVLGILETCLLAATLKLGSLLLVVAHPCEGYE